MAVYQQTKTFACDCERQLFTAIKTDNTSKDQAPQNISSQLPSEELFHPANFSSLRVNHAIYFTVWPKTGSEELYHIFEKNIFHPPPGIA
jgi:hypothetical protein